MGLLTRDFFFLKFQSCHFWGALSDERSGLSCVSLVFESTVVSPYLQLFTYDLQIYKVLNTFTKVIKYIQYIQASFSQ
jgi:hypothetical protein